MCLKIQWDGWKFFEWETKQSLKLTRQIEAQIPKQQLFFFNFYAVSLTIFIENVYNIYIFK